MRATLIHNPTAGSGGPSRDELVAAFRDAGWEVTYRSTAAGEGALTVVDPGDLVVAAGGDGTVADVAKRFVGRGVPLAILPIGTANNVARSLGVSGAPGALLAALRGGRLADVPRVPWDVGVARGPWGERRFVEAAGVGLFAALLRTVEEGGDPSGPDPVAGGRRRLRAVLRRATARAVRVDADGEDLSGDYLLAEVLNVRSVGPRVELAPRAGRGDGRLALVLMREEHRHPFDAWLAALLDGRDAASPLPVRPVRRVRLGWTPGAGRLDDELWPPAPPAPEPGVRDAPPAAREVAIAVADGGLEVLVPDG
jgi:diacylglycerol kinase family enzyme